MPLVLCFHGYGSNAVTIRNYSNLDAVADTANFMVVYPQGTVYGGSTHWNVGGWIIGSSIDDVDFTDALLDTISDSYTVDTNRIYSMGMSNGGFMSFLLACQMSDRIAAIASITGAMTPETYNGCDPQRPVPVLQMHGDDDSVVPYDGAIWTKSIEDVIQYWKDHNGTDNTAMVDSLENKNTNDGSEVVKHTYSNGDSCTSVEHYEVLGGDHDWPGAWGNLDINASKEAWRFMSKYNMNGLIKCSTTFIAQLPSQSTLKLFPNPTTSSVLIEGVSIGSAFRLYTSTGVLMQSGSVNERPLRIDLNDLRPSIYLLSIDNVWARIVRSD